MSQIEISVAIIDLECPQKGLVSLAEEAIAVINTLVAAIESEPGTLPARETCESVRHIRRNFSQAIDIYHNGRGRGRPEENFEAAVQTLKELVRHVETFEVHFNTVVNAQLKKTAAVSLADWRSCALAGVELKHTLERTVAGL